MIKIYFFLDFWPSKKIYIFFSLHVILLVQRLSAESSCCSLDLSSLVRCLLSLGAFSTISCVFPSSFFSTWLLFFVYLAAISTTHFLSPSALPYRFPFAFIRQPSFAGFPCCVSFHRFPCTLSPSRCSFLLFIPAPSFRYRSLHFPYPTCVLSLPCFFCWFLRTALILVGSASFLSSFRSHALDVGCFNLCLSENAEKCLLKISLRMYLLSSNS